MLKYVISIWLRIKYSNYYWITYKAIGYKDLIYNTGKIW